MSHYVRPREPRAGGDRHAHRVYRDGVGRGDAAGVLINTAGLLQAQAQQTGVETTAEVSDVIQVGEVIGIETNANNTIDTLNASVQLAAGAGTINLSKASYTIATENDATVVNGKNTSPGTANDGIEFHPKQGLVAGASTLSDQNDLIVVKFSLTDISGVSPLTESETITFISQSPAGGTTHKQLQAPRRIETNNAYVL